MPRKFIASVAVVCFFFSLLTVPPPIWATPSEAIPISYIPLGIPPEIASIEEAFLPAGDKNAARPLIHIQSVHAHAETQKKIYALLKFLEERYGIDSLFIEGAGEKLNPDYFRFFDDNRMNVKVAEKLVEKGELTGAELFLVESKRDIPAYGLEDPRLYRENLTSFQNVMRQRPLTTRFTADLQGILDRLESILLKKEARKLLRTSESFEAGQIPLLSYALELERAAQAVLAKDLRHFENQLDWPQMIRLLRLQEAEAKLDPEKIRSEQENLVSFMKGAGVNADLVESFQNLKFSPYQSGMVYDPGFRRNDLPRYLAERLVEATIEKGFTFEQYPAFTRYLEAAIIQSELEPSRLFEEMERLFNTLIKAVSENHEESLKLVALAHKERLYDRLFDLELTPKDHAKITAETQADRPLVRYLLDLESLHERTPLGRKKLVPENIEILESLFGEALRFYELAKQREEVMVETVIARSPAAGGTTKQSQGISILITGGFHTDGLSHAFRKRQVPYAIVTPRITEKVSSEAYIASLLGEKKSDFAAATLEQYGRSESRTVIEQMLGSAADKMLRSEIRQVIGALISETDQPLQEFLKLNQSRYFQDRRTEVRYNEQAQAIFPLLNGKPVLFDSEGNPLGIKVGRTVRLAEYLRPVPGGVTVPLPRSELRHFPQTGLTSGQREALDKNAQVLFDFLAASEKYDVNTSQWKSFEKESWPDVGPFDLVIVFGSSYREAAEGAAKIAKMAQDKNPNVIIIPSGHGPTTRPDWYRPYTLPKAGKEVEVPEAEFFADQMLKAGVARKNIIPELEATNTGQNTKNVRKIFDELRRDGRLGDNVRVLFLQNGRGQKRGGRSLIKQFNEGRSLARLGIQKVVSLSPFGLSASDFDEAKAVQETQKAIAEIGRFDNYAQQGFTDPIPIPEEVSRAIASLQTDFPQLFPSRSEVRTDDGESWEKIQEVANWVVDQLTPDERTAIAVEEKGAIEVFVQGTDLSSKLFDLVEQMRKEAGLKEEAVVKILKRIDTQILEIQGPPTDAPTLEGQEMRRIVVTIGKDPLGSSDRAIAVEVVLKNEKVISYFLYPDGNIHYKTEPSRLSTFYLDQGHLSRLLRPLENSEGILDELSQHPDIWKEYLKFPDVPETWKAAIREAPEKDKPARSEVRADESEASKAERLMSRVVDELAAVRRKRQDPSRTSILEDARRAYQVTMHFDGGLVILSTEVRTDKKGSLKVRIQKRDGYSYTLAYLESANYTTFSIERHGDLLSSRNLWAGDRLLEGVQFVAVGYGPKGDTLTVALKDEAYDSADKTVARVDGSEKRINLSETEIPGHFSFMKESEFVGKRKDLESQGFIFVDSSRSEVRTQETPKFWRMVGWVVLAMSRTGTRLTHEPEEDLVATKGRRAIVSFNPGLFRGNGTLHIDHAPEATYLDVIQAVQQSRDVPNVSKERFEEAVRKVAREELKFWPEIFRESDRTKRATIKRLRSVISRLERAKRLARKTESLKSKDPLLEVLKVDSPIEPLKKLLSGFIAAGWSRLTESDLEPVINAESLMSRIEKRHPELKKPAPARAEVREVDRDNLHADMGLPDLVRGDLARKSRTARSDPDSAVVLMLGDTDNAVSVSTQTAVEGIRAGMISAEVAKRSGLTVVDYSVTDPAAVKALQHLIVQESHATEEQRFRLADTNEIIRSAEMKRRVLTGTAQLTEIGPMMKGFVTRRLTPMTQPVSTKPATVPAAPTLATKTIEAIVEEEAAKILHKVVGNPQAIGPSRIESFKRDPALFIRHLDLTVERPTSHGWVLIRFKPGHSGIVSDGISFKGDYETGWKIKEAAVQKIRDFFNTVQTTRSEVRAEGLSPEVVKKFGKVLVVDDEFFMGDVLAGYLESLGFIKANTLIARNGEEALKVFKANPNIGLIVSDIQMPEMDGREFVKAARAIRPTPAIFMTGSAIATITLDGMSFPVLGKPFVPKNIEDTLNSIASGIVTEPEEAAIGGVLPSYDPQAIYETDYAEWIRRLEASSDEQSKQLLALREQMNPMEAIKIYQETVRSYRGGAYKEFEAKPRDFFQDPNRFEMLRNKLFVAAEPMAPDRMATARTLFGLHYVFTHLDEATAASERKLGTPERSELRDTAEAVILRPGPLRGLRKARGPKDDEVSFGGIRVKTGPISPVAGRPLAVGTASLSPAFGAFAPALMIADLPVAYAGRDPLSVVAVIVKFRLVDILTVENYPEVAKALIEALRVADESAVGVEARMAEELLRVFPIMGKRSSAPGVVVAFVSGVPSERDLRAQVMPLFKNQNLHLLMFVLPGTIPQSEMRQFVERTAMVRQLFPDGRAKIFYPQPQAFSLSLLKELREAHQRLGARAPVPTQFDPFLGNFVVITFSEELGEIENLPEKLRSVRSVTTRFSSGDPVKRAALHYLASALLGKFAQGLLGPRRGDYFHSKGNHRYSLSEEALLHDLLAVLEVFSRFEKQISAAA